MDESTLTDSWEMKIENLATISNCFKDFKVSTIFQKQLTVIPRILYSHTHIHTHTHRVKTESLTLHFKRKLIFNVKIITFISVALTPAHPDSQSAV